MSSTTMDTPLVQAASKEDSSGGVSLWKDAWHRLLRNKMAIAGGIFLIFLVAICIAIRFWHPFEFDEQNLELGVSKPNNVHWMGTDALGRDLFTRVLYGGGVSLSVGFLASMVAVIIGVIYGAISGFLGGKTDSVMMRVVDVLYALPFVFLVIILMVYFGRNKYLLFLALGFTEWLTMARIVRGQVISLKEKEFIRAARSMGVTNSAIIFRHLIPNTLGPVIVYLTLTVPTAILQEAFLSFLGLGIQAPEASWGTLISNGVELMEQNPHVLLFPAAFLSATLFSLNFLGDGLRDALDPKGAKD